MWVWLHNGQEIAPSESDGVSYEEAGPTSTLTISSLTEEDRGVYQCLLTQQSTGREAEHNQYIDVVGKQVNYDNKTGGFSTIDRQFIN